MKIVCDNCSTKYSIADEKVRGKVFKIRCKKCSHIIVVKGTDGEGAAAGHGGTTFDQKETKVFDYGAADAEPAAAGGGDGDLAPRRRSRADRTASSRGHRSALGEGRDHRGDLLLAPPCS